MAFWKNPAVLEPTISPRGKRWLVILLVLAASVRLCLLWRYYCISSDGVVYLRAAKDFYTGDIASALASVYPPGYPLLIAAVYPLFGNWELAGQSLSLLFGVLLLLPLYRLFAEIFDENVALLASFLAGISPFLALYSAHVRSESTYILISTLALYLFLTAIERNRPKRFFGGGMLAGYAYLVRPEAIGFLVIIPAIALLRAVRRRQNILRNLVPGLGLLALGFSLFALPYIIYLSSETGRFGAISRKAGITLAINLKESGALEGEDLRRDDFIDSFVFTDYVRRHPFQYLESVATDLMPAVGVFFDALYYSYVPFLLLGLCVALREKPWRKPQALLLGFVLFYVFGFALIYVKRRYSLQAVPACLGWVALGMVYAWNKLRAACTERKAVLVAACVVVIFLAVTLPKTLKSVSREKAYVRETGWYLKERNRAGALKVAVLDERVAFYAAARAVMMTEIKQADLPAQLRQQRANYLAAESRSFQETYPQIAQAPERYGLILEKVFVGTRKDQMLLFKVL